MFSEDINTFFADGVVAQHGGNTASVWLDMPDQGAFGEMQMSTDYAITYATGTLPGLKHGDAITVDSVAYKVRNVTKIDDGAVSKATLSKV